MYPFPNSCSQGQSVTYLTNPSLLKGTPNVYDSTSTSELGPWRDQVCPRSLTLVTPLTQHPGAPGWTGSGTRTRGHFDGRMYGQFGTDRAGHTTAPGTRRTRPLINGWGVSIWAIDKSTSGTTRTRLLINGWSEGC
jgi:hypothetical protein